MVGMISLQRRVLAALEAGYTQKQLQEAAQVSSGAVSQWKNGQVQSLATKSVLGLASLTGWNAKWWAEGIGPKLRNQSHPQAQLLSLDEHTVPPRAQEWGELLTMDIDEMPDAFRVALPDDAMAPGARQGWVVEFEHRRVRQPVYTNGVLIRLKNGEMHFRRFVQDPGGTWLARADNEARGFPTFRPEHVAEVLAVARSVVTPWQ